MLIYKLYHRLKTLINPLSNEIVDGDIVINRRHETPKTRLINGNLKIRTSNFGNLSNIEVNGSITIESNLGLLTLDNLPLTLQVIVYGNTPS